jgi:hypothetical protein
MSFALARKTTLYNKGKRKTFHYSFFSFCPLTNLSINLDGANVSKNSVEV